MFGINIYMKNIKFSLQRFIVTNLNYVFKLYADNDDYVSKPF